MMRVGDKGPWVAAVAALIIAGTAWLRADGGRSQQLADLTSQVQQLGAKVDRLQSVIDDYLLRHDGH